MQLHKSKGIGWQYSLVAALALMLAGCGDTPEDLMRRAGELQAGGQYQAALAEYRNVLEQDSGNPQARLGVAENNLYLGEYSRAEDALQRAAELDVDPEQLQPLLAAALLAQQDHEGVLERIEPDSVSEPELTAELYAARARAHLELGETDQAEEAAQSALDAHGDSPRALTVAGRIALTQGQQERARERLDQALAGEDRIAAALLVRAQLALQQREVEQAVDLLAEAIDRPPTDLSASLRERFMARGQRIELLLGQDRVAEAKEVLDVMLRQASDHPYANYLAGAIAFQEDRISDAVERLQTTLSATSGNTAAKALMGAVRLEQEQYAQAVSLLEEVVNAQPDNVAARVRLVAALRERGADDQAIETLTEGVRRAQDDSAALSSLVRAAAEDIEAVVAELDLGPGSDDQSRDTRMRLAQALVGTGNADPAVSMLRSMEPGEGDEEFFRRQFLTVANLRAGDDDAALEEAEALVADYPDNAGAHNLLGGIHLAADRFDAAREAFEQARDRNPDDPQPRFNLGLVAAASGDLEQAASHFEGGLERDPDNIGAVLRLAAIQRRSGNVEAAIEWTQRAVEAAPDSAGARLALARLQVAHGDTDAALEATAAAVEAAPENAVAHGLRGAALLDNDDATGAVESLQRARELAPDDPRVHFELARAQAAAEEPEAARETLTELIEAQPEYLRAYPVLVRLQMQADEDEAALATAERLQEQDGGEARGVLLAGRVHQETGDREAAAEAYERAVELGNTDALQPLVAVRQAMGADEPARPLEEWVQNNPEAHQGRVALANWYLEQEEYSDAIRHYEELADQTDREDAGVLNNLAWLYSETGDDRARATAEEALDLAPGNPALQDTLGWIHYQEGRVDDAVELLSQAAEQASEAAEIQYHYGAALAEAGDNTRARMVLERALELDDDADWAQEARNLLDDL